MGSEIVGITTCDYCRSRFRVQKRHTALEGKEIRCPKCHRQFVMKVERPSPVEQAAIKNSEVQKEPRLRRTRTQIRKEHTARIKKSFRPFHNRLTEVVAQESSSEEEVRRWCIDVLRHVLGYEDVELDTEMKALNQRIDIALKKEDKVFLVVEIKNARSKLPANVRDQAVMYALNKSADWAVITNGQIWKLYRVFPVKGSDPTAVEVFDLALLDDDGLSDDDVDKFYLLTSRAIFGGETERSFHRIACLSNRRVLQAITSTRAIKAIRRSLIDSYKKEACEQVKLADEMVIDRVREMFLPADL